MARDERQLEGGMAAANKLFDKLAKGGKVISKSDTHTTFELPDGAGTVTLRTKQKSGTFVATIDVRVSGIGTKELKFVKD